MLLRIRRILISPIQLLRRWGAVRLCWRLRQQLRLAGHHGEAEWNSGHALRHRPNAVRPFKERERAPFSVGELAKFLDRKAGIQQAAEDLLEVVAPVVVGGVGYRAFGVFRVAAIALVSFSYMRPAAPSSSGIISRKRQPMRS